MAVPQTQHIFMLLGPRICFAQLNTFPLLFKWQTLSHALGLSLGIACSEEPALPCIVFVLLPCAHPTTALLMLDCNSHFPVCLLNSSVRTLSKN